MTALTPDNDLDTAIIIATFVVLVFAAVLVGGVLVGVDKIVQWLRRRRAARRAGQQVLRGCDDDGTGRCGCWPEIGDDISRDGTPAVADIDTEIDQMISSYRRKRGGR